MKTTIIKDSTNPRVYKAFDDTEFIGFVVHQADSSWLFNPHCEVTLKSAVFPSYEKLWDWLHWSDY